MLVQTYTKKLRAALSPRVSNVFSKLNTPNKIQDYLDALPINFDMSGDLLSSKRVIEQGKAQCIEGALFAAASLAYHGHKPILMDFQTSSFDEDHVIALFSVPDGSASGGKEKRLWGAISKTNHAILRFRDPVYKTLRELAMSYFHEYYMHDGRKTMRAYSGAFDLRRYKPEFWVMSEESLEQIASDLDDVRHFPIVPKEKMKSLRRASPVERKMLDHVEWKDPRKKRRSN